MKFFDEDGREVIFLTINPSDAPVKTVNPTIITRNVPPQGETGTNRNIAKKYLRPKELKDVYGVSESKMMQLAREAKAIYKVDKVVLINIEKMDAYIETFIVEE